MASFFPETPYCVISEKTLRNSDKSPFNLSSNLYNSHLDEINREYQEKQYNYLIDKYLDIDCDDDVLFMSPSGDRDIDSKFSFKNFPGLIEKRFALLKPIDSCEVTIKASNPGDYFFSRIPVEDLYEFNFSSHPKKKFNKIIVKNCLPFFDKHQAYFCEFLSSLLKNTLPYVPCILLIQRVNNLSTLPFHQSVYNDWAKSDTEYLKFIETIKAKCFSVRFNIETLKCYINCKSSWYSNLRDKSVYPLNQRLIISDEHVENDGLIGGIRELNEGLFKYQDTGTNLEISDRMLFIGATLLKKHIHSENMLEIVKNKKKEATVYDAKREIDIEEEIKSIRHEIAPMNKYECKGKAINNFMGKRWSKPKGF